MLRWLSCALLLCASCALAAEPGAAPEPVPAVQALDDFADAAAWRVEASGGASGSLRAEADRDEAALCLDHAFTGLTGTVAIRRDLPANLPQPFRLSLRMRGHAPDNDLRLTMVDADGVAHSARRVRFDVPEDWQAVRWRARHFGGEVGLERIQSVEIAVENGIGGRGSLCFDALLVEAMAEDDGTPLLPVAAMSTVPASDPMLLPGAASGAWQAPAGPQRIVLDLGRSREFGGVRLRWLPGRHASRYALSVSDDGLAWHRAGAVSRGNGGDDWIALPGADARYLLLDLFAGPGEGYALAGIELQPPAFAEDTNALLRAVAAHSPKGWFPPGLDALPAPTAWLGVDGGGRLGHLAADGTVGVEGGSFSVSPSVLVDGRVVRRDAVAIERSASVTGVPVRSVHWKRDDLDLRITAFAHRSARESQIVVRYRLVNPGPKARDYRLALLVQPLRIVRMQGDAHASIAAGRIGALGFEGGVANIDGMPLLFSRQLPDAAFATPFEAGMAASHIGAGRLPTEAHVQDASGLASGAWLYRLRLRGWESREIDVMLPMSGTAALARRWWDADTLQQDSEAHWRALLDAIMLPQAPERHALADALRQHAAWLLASRPVAATPALSPCRWHEVSAMADDLSRLGLVDAARQAQAWLSRHAVVGLVDACCEGDCTQTADSAQTDTPAADECDWNRIATLETADGWAWPQRPAKACMPGGADFVQAVYGMPEASGGEEEAGSAP